VRVTIANNVFRNNIGRFNLGGLSTPHAILVYGAVSTSITGNVIDGTCAPGIWVGTGPVSPLHLCTIAGNTIINAGVTSFSTAGVPGGGIYVLGDRAGIGVCTEVSIVGNVIRGTRGDGIIMYDTEGFTISGNSVRLSQNNGISLNYCKEGTITGNTLLDNGTSASGLELNGIMFFATSATQTCDNVLVSGNRIGDTRAGGARTQAYAFYFVGGGNLGTITVHGNNVRNNLTGVIGGAPALTLTMRANVGYNYSGISNQGLGASPWTYQAAYAPEQITISSSLGNNFSITKGGITLAPAGTTTPVTFTLEPLESFTLTIPTSSAGITMAKDIK
jgi:parallel beta-helix repeat protein